MIGELKPYSAYKDSGLPWLGEVPEHWEIQRGKNLFQCIDIRSAKGEEELLTVSSERGVIPRKTANVTMFKAESYAGHKLCWPGDLVINSLWAWAKGLGISQHHGIVSTAYGVYRTRKSAFDTRFIDLLVRSTSFQWELQVRSKGVWMSRLQLTDDSFLNAPFPVPPVEEQAQIATFLDYADRRIRRYIRSKQKLIKLLEEQKQVIINQAVTRGLDPNVPLKPSGIEWLSDIPEHWEVIALKRVLRQIIDCEHKTAPAVDSSPFRVVRTSAVRSGRFLLEGTYCTTEQAFLQWTQRATPEAGDVIFTREAPAGEACVIPQGQTVCLGQRTVLMKVRREAYDPQFLVHMIYAGPPRDRIRLASQGSTVGHFNMDDIGWMLILKPPLIEQHHIVSVIGQQTKELDLTCSHAELEISLLREFHTRLIADVVTGKLDVREAAAHLPAELDETEPLEEDLPDPELDLDADRDLEATAEDEAA